MNLLPDFGLGCRLVNHNTFIKPREGVIQVKKMSSVDWVAFVLVIVGALNWGLVGFFQYDLVAKIFGGSDTTIARLVYDLVGIGALWMLYGATMKAKE